jgi:FAD dependent oxidoreductase
VARTTSWKAGGLFASPSQLTEVDGGIARKQLQQSKDVIEQFSRIPRLLPRLGIARCPGYVLDDRGGTRLQLGANVHRSRPFETWLIDPIVLLPALKSDLGQRRVRFIPRQFATLADVAALPERIIVNCTGLGARNLFGDASVEALRGHLVVLKNPQKLNYMLSGWCEAGTRYLFARTHDIVIGGTMYRGSEAADFDATNPSDVATCRRILRNARGLFDKGGQECG